MVRQNKHVKSSSSDAPAVIVADDASLSAAAATAATEEGGAAKKQKKQKKHAAAAAAADANDSSESDHHAAPAADVDDASKKKKSKKRDAVVIKEEKVERALTIDAAAAPGDGNGDEKKKKKKSSRSSGVAAAAIDASAAIIDASSTEEQTGSIEPDASSSSSSSILEDVDTSIDANLHASISGVSGVSGGISNAQERLQTFAVSIHQMHSIVSQVVGQLSAMKTNFKVLEKSINKEVKQVHKELANLQVQAAKQQGKKARRAGGGNRQPSGFVKPTEVSTELCAFLGTDPAVLMSRTDVSRHINQYIRANRLQDVTNGRRILPDAALAKLLNMDVEKDELTYFNLQRYMKHHFMKKQDAGASSVGAVEFKTEHAAANAANADAVDAEEFPSPAADVESELSSQSSYAAQY